MQINQLGSNHNHVCTSTCVQYVKNKGAAKDSLQANAVPKCRFWFFRVLSFMVALAGRLQKIRVRRRGKRLVPEPFIHSTDDHNEFGRAAVLRTMPGTSSSSDVGGVFSRGNNDCQYLERAPPEECDSEGIIEATDQRPGNDTPDGKPAAPRDSPGVSHGNRKETFLYGVRASMVRGIKASILGATRAVFRAAHCCDFYITKYLSKPMQNVQPVMSQMAAGIRRLEQEYLQEEQARLDGSDAQQQKKSRSFAPIVQRARRTCLRLAASANRCFWLSSCEIMVTLLTGGNMFQTHTANNLFTKQILWKMMSCKRELNGEAAPEKPNDNPDVSMFDVSLDDSTEELPMSEDCRQQSLSGSGSCTESVVVEICPLLAVQSASPPPHPSSCPISPPLG